MKKIVKRDGKVVPFESVKITEAVKKAFLSTKEIEEENINRMASIITGMVLLNVKKETPTVEEIQDEVEKALMDLRLTATAKAYILYREEHNKERSRKEKTMDFLSGKFLDITSKGVDSEVTKGASGNANVDTESPMGKMLSYGAEFSKTMALETLVSPEFASAHKNGDIHIHDLDFLPTKTLTCCQIDLEKLFRNGFSTGHGYQREPQSIGSYAALAAIALQSNQNEQHGGQSIPMFDFYLAPGVLKTFRKEFRKLAERGLEDLGEKVNLKEIVDEINTISFDVEEIAEKLKDSVAINSLSQVIGTAYERALEDTERQTYQAMEGLVHNLNTMHSRAGAQVPFTSINFGTDTSEEGRMVIKNFLLATEAGLGNGETPIFPISIFKVKEGVNYNPEDPNYDLFKLACRVSAKRLFPNFSFIDSSFNKQYYKPGHPETEVTYMGCRTRVIGNVCGEETVTGRGNLSFTSINMPRLAIEARNMFYDDRDEKFRIEKFNELLDEKLELCKNQLLERMALQATATPRNFTFLMGEGVWRGSENLGPDDTVAEVIKQGTLSIGFIGLAETLTELIGEHQGESDRAEELGLEIVRRMREFCDQQSWKLGLNITLLATPAEGLSGRFVKMDREKYGTIKGVTDKKYYTNSFHVPVGYKISAFDKIKKEAPYHKYTNAGHISYIELDGDPSKNLDAFEAIVRAEKEAGMGYAAINHPVDRDPVCGYTGVIDDVCPCCGRREHPENSSGPKFERIRRITGYLVGTMDKWNEAKTAEEADRVKHNNSGKIY